MRKERVIAGAVAALCLVSVITLLSWPKFQDGTWQTVAAPSWWQFEWLAAIGVGLSAIPSLIVATVDDAVGISATIRNVLSGTLLVLEITVISFVVHKVAQRLLSSGAKAQQGVQADAWKPTRRLT